MSIGLCVFLQLPPTSNIRSKCTILVYIKLNLVNKNTFILSTTKIPKTFQILEVLGILGWDMESLAIEVQYL